MIGGRSIGADLYSEFQLVFDHSAFRIGITAGYIYRESRYSYWDYYMGNYESRDMHVVPLHFDLSILPLRFAAPNMMFQVYLGVAPGIFLSLGDWPETTFSVAPKFGFEFYFGEFFVMGFEGRFCFVPDDFSYIAVLMGLRFRIPFRRRVY